MYMYVSRGHDQLMFKLRIHRHHALALDAGNIVPALTGLRPGAHFTSIVDIRVLLFMIEVVNINTGGLLLSSLYAAFSALFREARRIAAS